MSRPLQLLSRGLRFCGAGVVAFAVWTLWLTLALLLVVQIYIATHHELEVPAFVLRTFEDRLAASGVRVTFGRTSFDPTGRVLIEDARLFLPAFAEPVFSAHGLYTRLDPWALAAGKFEPREVRVTGASLAIPAMLSRSGAAEEILRDLDALLVPGDHALTVAQFSAHIAGVSVSARGSVYLPAASTARSAPLPGADFLAKNFTALCRQLEAARTQLATLDQPELHLDLSPSESRAVIANVTLSARGWKLTSPLPLQIGGLRIVTKFPLLGDAPVAARLEFTADDLVLPFDARAHRVRASIRGTLRPAQVSFVPRELELSAEALTAADFYATTVAARLTPGPLPQIDGDIVARIMGEPLAIRGSADFKAETATVHFDGAISPAVMGPISARVHTDARRFFNFKALECTGGLVTIGPGWKFEKVSARTVIQGIEAYHVQMEEGRAVVEFDGRHLHAPEAWARIGENFARGSYDHDLGTRDFRFLLAGQLRPLDISGWFGPWWPNFFNDFALPVAPPRASVDIQGRWGESRYSSNFISVETIGPVIRGTKLDFARARLFVRPAFYDAPEFWATSGTGAVRGTFTYATDPETFAWRSLQFNVASTIDPAVAVQMMGPGGASVLAPFAFAQPPALKLAGRIDGPAAPGGAHQTITIEARSAGAFHLHEFPLENIAFTAAIRDDDVAIDNLHAGFAGGVATGRVKLTGRGADRRLSAELAVKDTSLGRAAAILQDYAAKIHGLPPPPPGKFVQEKANVRLDLTASAEGRYADPFSYHGEGNATLQGAGLGEVPLLGQLSELLKFTALRFTAATAKFKIDGAKLAFSEFNLRGANSAIEAHGNYALDRRELDFKAKLLPFQESANILKSAIGAVLTPFSNVFEVVLTGSLEKPQWAFAMGPTNLLRSFGSGETPPVPPGEGPLAVPVPRAKP